MRRAPRPEDYARMTDQVRQAAAALMREEADAVAERRARVAERRLRARQKEAEGNAHTVAQARILLPVYMARHNDTEALQTIRRAALEADSLAYGDPRVREAVA
jgi:hypothetical protein